MKITKIEKIWLIVVIALYACYNLPFVPAYGLAKATLIHATITLIPLWIAIYVGFAKVCRIYKLKDNPDDPKHEKEINVGETEKISMAKEDKPC